MVESLVCKIFGFHKKLTEITALMMLMSMNKSGEPQVAAN